MNTLKLYRFSSPIQLQPLEDNPNSSSEEGSLYYSSTEGAIRIRQENSWENLATIRYVDAQEFGADHVYMTFGGVEGAKAVDDIIRWNGSSWQNAKALQQPDGTGNAIIATSDFGLLDPTFLWQNIDMNYYTFYNIPDPVFDTDVSNKNYVDNQWFGDNNVLITPHPTTLRPYNNDLIRWDDTSQVWRNVAAKQVASSSPMYQDEVISTNMYGRLDKSFLYYNLDRQGYSIYGLPTPSIESEAATKGYVDAADGALANDAANKYNAAISHADGLHSDAINHANSLHVDAINHTNDSFTTAMNHIDGQMLSDANIDDRGSLQPNYILRYSPSFWDQDIFGNDFYDEKGRGRWVVEPTTERREGNHKNKVLRTNSNGFLDTSFLHYNWGNGYNRIREVAGPSDGADAANKDYVDFQPFGAANVRFYPGDWNNQASLKEGDLIIYAGSDRPDGGRDRFWTNIDSLKIGSNTVQIFQAVTYETNIDNSVTNKTENITNNYKTNRYSYSNITNKTSNTNYEINNIQDQRTFTLNSITNIDNSTNYINKTENITKKGIFITEDHRTINDYGEHVSNNYNTFSTNYITTIEDKREFVNFDYSTKNVENKTVQVGTFDYSTKNTNHNTVNDFSTNYNTNIENNTSFVTNDNRTVYETNHVTQRGNFFYANKNVTEQYAQKVVNEEHKTINNSYNDYSTKNTYIQNETKFVDESKHYTQNYYQQATPPSAQKPGKVAIEGRDTQGRPKAGVQLDTDGNLRNHASSFRKAAGKNDPEASALHLVSQFQTDLRVMKNGSGYISEAAFNVTDFTGSKIEYRLKDRITGHSRIGTLYIAAQIPDVTYGSHTTTSTEFQLQVSTIFLGQTFTSNYTGTISTVQFWLRRGVDTTGNLRAAFYAVGGTGLPSGQPLGFSETVNIATETTSSGAPVLFTLTNGMTVNSGTKYAVVLMSVGAISGGSVFVGLDANNYSGGDFVRSSNSGTSWQKVSSQDLYFTVGGPQPSSGTSSSFSDFYSETAEMGVMWNTEVVNGQVQLHYQNASNDKWLHLDATYFPH